MTGSSSTAGSGLSSWLGLSAVSGIAGPTLLSVTAQDIFKGPFLAQGEWVSFVVLKYLT